MTPEMDPRLVGVSGSEYIARVRAIEFERESSLAWARPVPLVPVPRMPRFPVHALPPLMSDFVSGVAESTQTPLELAGLLSLTTVSALIARHVVVEARGGFREPTNLFTAVSLPPGERKTAVYQLVVGPLEEIEETLVEAARTAYEFAKAQRRADEQAAKRAERDAAKATGQERLQHLAEAADLNERLNKQMEPALPRLIADDATPEAVASLLAQQGGRIAVLSDEGGIFDLLAGRYSKNGAPNIQTFLKGHSASTIRVDRKGRVSEDIKRPAITVGLTVQPDVLRTVGEQRVFEGRGLLARFLWAVPASRVGRRNTAPAPLSRDVKERWGASLQVVHDVFGAGDHVLTLDAAAAMLFATFERELEPRLGPGGDLEPVAAWASKLAGAVLRLSGVLGCAEPAQPAEPDAMSVGEGGSAGSAGCATTKIDEATMAHAIEIAEFLIPHALMAFDVMGDSSQTMTRARKVAEWIQRTGLTEFSVRDAFDQNRGSLIRRADDLKAALVVLVDHEWIRREPDPEPSEKGGRPPSPRFVVNPAVTREATT